MAETGKLGCGKTYQAHTSQKKAYEVILINDLVHQEAITILDLQASDERASKHTHIKQKSTEL